VVSFYSFQFEKRTALKSTSLDDTKRFTLKLEKLVDVFFISIYRENIRVYVFPVKKLSENKMTIYNPDLRRYEHIKN